MAKALQTSETQSWLCSSTDERFLTVWCHHNYHRRSHVVRCRARGHEWRAGRPFPFTSRRPWTRQRMRRGSSFRSPGPLSSPKHPPAQPRPRHLQDWRRWASSCWRDEGRSARKARWWVEGKDDPIYGWRSKKRSECVSGIPSGVRITIMSLCRRNKLQVGIRDPRS